MSIKTRAVNVQIIQSGGGSELVGPEFSYTGDVLTSITYDDGTVKTFTYSGDQLTRIDTAFFGGNTVRKDFIYSGDTLIRIDQTII